MRFFECKWLILLTCDGGYGIGAKTRWNEYGGNHGGKWGLGQTFRLRTRNMKAKMRHKLLESTRHNFICMLELQYNVPAVVAGLSVRSIKYPWAHIPINLQSNTKKTFETPMITQIKKDIYAAQSQVRTNQTSPRTNTPASFRDDDDLSLNAQRHHSA
mgnify:CR=1 FL=1